MYFKKLANSARNYKTWLGAASIAGLGLGASFTSSEDNKRMPLNAVRANYFQVPQILRMGLPQTGVKITAECGEQEWKIYRREEVQKESRENKKVWVTYGNGVYDLTEFAKSHPGGSDKLLMARGGPIEPFWQMYPFHKTEQIIGLLKAFKIGELDARDVLAEKDLPDFTDLQTQNLNRSDKLEQLTKFPYNAQTNPQFMTFKQENFLTPPREQFERNHNLIPEIDIEDYELVLMANGKDGNEVTLTFD